MKISLRSVAAEIARGIDYSWASPEYLAIGGAKIIDHQYRVRLKKGLTAWEWFWLPLGAAFLILRSVKQEVLK